MSCIEIILYLRLVYPPCPADCNFETDCSLKWSYYNAEQIAAWFVRVPSSSVQPNVEPTFNKEGSDEEIVFLSLEEALKRCCCSKNLA